MNPPRLHPHDRTIREIAAVLLVALSMMAWAQEKSRSGNSCSVHRVTTLPGSHQFASDFIETIATDPDSHDGDSNAIWAVTADLSSTVPRDRRAIYISRSTDGGISWKPIARIDSRYYNAKISEGLRNGLGVSPGGKDFVLTTQMGAFQVVPQRGTLDAVVTRLPGPKVPPGPPPVQIPKTPGEPVRAGVVKITADGRRMIVGYGYFDLNPQLFLYRREGRSWVEDETLPHLPTNLDIFSMSFDDPTDPHPASLYVGTGDQAYRLDLRTLRWTHVEGVGPDSAIHSMTTVGGLHLAACWGVYEPVSQDVEARVTGATFLLHPNKDEAGPNIRAYDVQVDPLHPNRQAVAAITGVYTSDDAGQTWHRVNGLPEGEFHTAHFSSDGTVLVSGMIGTWIVNPFDAACRPELRTRD